MMTSMVKHKLIDLESESEEEKIIFLLHSRNKIRERRKKNKYLQRRDSHGEFKLSTEIPDNVFKETFRLNRSQFEEVHCIIQNDIVGRECNAQKPIDSREKLAVCLR